VSLFILLLLGLIWIVFRTRERNIKKKAQDEQQKIILEKELIELEHKALRLQMNPHFIFNALNSIQSQIGTDNEQNARYYLAKFSKLMRQILDNSRNNTISLQEEISMLDNYLLVEKFCNNDMFDYKIHLQDDLELDYIKIPPMILQPFVENAIKHGMKYLASKRGLIELSFKEENNMLICAITDNGVGRKKAEELNKLSREHFHKSTALKVTEERLSLLHQNDNGDNIHIVDLYDDAGAGAGAASGTKVEVKIPIT
jgi:LytS/YehU family sensor histidine kinase